MGRDRGSGRPLGRGALYHRQESSSVLIAQTAWVQIPSSATSQLGDFGQVTSLLHFPFYIIGTTTVPYNTSHLDSTLQTTEALKGL